MENIDDALAGIFLFVYASGNLCGLPIQNVIETMRPLPCKPVAGQPSFVRGLSVVRGETVPVASLPKLISGTDSTEHAQRCVTLRVGARKMSLLVDSVVGVRRVEPKNLIALPPLLETADGGVVSRIGELDRDFLMVLETSRIIPEELWSALGVGGDRA